VIRCSLASHVGEQIETGLVGLLKKVGNDTTKPKPFRFCSDEGSVSVMYGLDVENKLVLSLVVTPAGGISTPAPHMLGWWSSLALNGLKQLAAARLDDVLVRRHAAR
jgi:hypothetical protein